MARSVWLAVAALACGCSAAAPASKVRPRWPQVATMEATVTRTAPPEAIMAPPPVVARRVDGPIVWSPGGDHIAYQSGTEVFIAPRSAPGRPLARIDARTSIYAFTGNALLVRSNRGEQLQVVGLDGTLLSTWEPGGWIDSVVASPDGKRVAISFHDRDVQLWDGESRRFVARLPGARGPVAFNAAGDRVATALRRNLGRVRPVAPVVQVWDVARGTPVGRHGIPQRRGEVVVVSRLAFHPTEPQLAAAVTRAGWDPTTVIRILGGGGSRRLAQLPDTPAQLLFTPDGAALIAVLSPDRDRRGRVDAFQVSSGARSWTKPLASPGSYTPDARTLLTADRISM